MPGYISNGKVKQSPKLEINELEILLKEFLINKYNFIIHSETKEIPRERWKNGNFIPRMPESLEELDLLLLTERKTRKVHHDGIRFNKIKYIEPSLAAYVGEEVVIRYDPRDIVEIRIFYNEKFLCRAISQELLGQDVSLKDIIRVHNKRRKNLRNEIKKRDEFVKKLLEATYKEDTKDDEIDESPKRKLKRYIHEYDWSKK